MIFPGDSWILTRETVSDNVCFDLYYVVAVLNKIYKILLGIFGNILGDSFRWIFKL